MKYSSETQLYTWLIEDAPDIKIGAEPKYTKEQRDFAVKYYKEHGESVSETLRVLQYPSAQRLRQWIREDAPDIQLKTGYTKEQREIAVKYYVDHNESISETIKALKYPSAKQLRRWVCEDIPNAKF